MKSINPYQKIYHKALLISDKGVSALCYKRPRPINLKTHLWTTADYAVTCKKCLKLMKPITVTDPA